MKLNLDANNVLAGSLTVQLEKKPPVDSNGNPLLDDNGNPVRGEVIKKETHRNAITAPFLKLMLARTFSTEPLATALRGGTKTASVPPGQFMSLHTSGANASGWGIYAMDGVYPVTKATKLPPYINSSTTYNENVTFYNVAGSTTETSREMVPQDSRTGYAFIDGGENSHTVEFIKNTGQGTVRSVIIGRAHASPISTQGVLLGEWAHQANWINGSAGTCVQTMFDRTRLIKAANSETRVLDLKTKDIWDAAAGREIINSGITGAQWSSIVAGGTTASAGSVLVNANPYRVDYVSNAAGTSVTVRLSMWTTAAAAPVANQKDIVIPIEAGTTAMTYHPITLFNPVDNTIEAFVSVSRGAFPGNKFGVNVKKIVFSNFPPNQTGANAIGMADIEYEIMDLGIWATAPAAPAMCQGLGFYDHEAEKYYLPCFVNINPNTGAEIVRGDTTFCQGYIFDAIDMSVVGDWIARSTGSNTVGGSIVPVRTDMGVTYCIYDLATPYYPNISQVISGVVLAEDYVKTSDNVLRLIYCYSLS